MMDASRFPSLGRTFLAIALFGLGQFPASISAEESTGSEPAAPRLLHDPVAIASAPLPDPTPKPVVLPPAVVLDTVEYILPAEGRSIIVQKTEPPPGYVPPPVTPPPAPLPAVPSEEFLAKARAAAANRPRMRYLRFSATVYPGGTEDAARKATLVRWTHDRQSHQAWSGRLERIQWPWRSRLPFSARNFAGDAPEKPVNGARHLEALQALFRRFPSACRKSDRLPGMARPGRCSLRFPAATPGREPSVHRRVSPRGCRDQGSDPRWHA